MDYFKQIDNPLTAFVRIDSETKKQSVFNNNKATVVA
jgi:hypothetical protein